MSTITRYVLVDADDNEQDYEYERYTEAESDARRDGFAVIAREYVYDDSELVWTPDGSDSWPPDDALTNARGRRKVSA